jgi:PBP1b-binding outer membrane lipoprotein LpoB
MKKIVILMFAISIAIVLTGCTNGSKNTDNADSALIDSTGSSGVMSPPVPPEPTR